MTTSTTLTRPPSTTTTASDRTLSVLVVELDDVVPRRHPDLPNLYVGVTVESHGKKIDHIARGARPKWARNHVVRLRPDLYAGFGLTTSEAVRRQKKALVAELRQQGYTVNRNSDVWSTYVVQLDETQSDDIGQGWVYVGETKRKPDERLQQHLSGARNGKGRLYSPIVHRYGQSLRYDLMRDLPRLYSKAASKKAEAQLAKRLRAQGYKVEGGH